MKLSEHLISFAGQDLLLTNQRAVYWPQEHALVLSDLHLGKAAHFRKNGIPLPTTVSEQDLFRLQNLVLHYTPQQVIIVGDLMHAGANTEVALLRDLTTQFPNTRFILIKGNHDRHSLQQLQGWGIFAFFDELQLSPIRFSHHPRHNGHPTISGHIHPGIRIQMPHKRYARLPCYVVTKDQLILPAFSLFTGLDTRSISDNAVYYAIYGDRVFEVSP
ncbi:ligase-associated DNA damage response endonuclease PdeM [Parapedobacter sp. SGR-10]|uniref:ligase-associated DNA damage response endonuclease PdeM n=1 Tax=Parapedobacter sp. SGR-10 TaxID=2710879 RepID=UPI0013D127BB|nr:ligase-associated DNA damage response endonuclease PdeM [Parapedobacter sp. SGR-10]NGF57061.1 ligase-associated DNA damage response endonuclease PdeM [Parapedobacter sp. SGR-10]